MSYDHDFEDDYEYEDPTDDEELEQEFELDEIKSFAAKDLEAAKIRLNAMAVRYSTTFCVDAALELLKLQPTLESFLTLANALANAPASNDAHRDMQSIERGFDLITANIVSNLRDLEIWNEAIRRLKEAGKQRLYFKSILCLAHGFLSAGYAEEASRVLESRFYPELEQIGIQDVWAASLLSDARILDVDIVCSMSPVDRMKLRGLLALIRGERSQLVDLLDVCLVSEAEARICIEERRLQDASHLLKKNVRAFLDSLGTQVNTNLLTRSFLLLVLISLIRNENSNAETELSVADKLKQQPVVSHALNVLGWFSGQSITVTVLEMYKSLSEVQSWLLSERWKVGVSGLTEAVVLASLRLQVNRILRDYDRIKLSTLFSQVKSPDEETSLTTNILHQFIMEDSLDGPFRLNLVDNTLDRVNGLSDWRGYKVRPNLVSSDLPFPSRYADYSQRQLLNKQEDAILNKWKSHTNSTLTQRNRQFNANDRPVQKKLRKTHDSHVESMMT